MASKRPIDRFREGAGSTTVPPECGNIVAVFGSEQQRRMYLLCEHGISSGIFADQIDPERKNAAIPQIVQQMELDFGANDEFVRQTVGMAMSLFKDGTHLPEAFDREAAFFDALSVAKDLGELTHTIAELSRSADAIREKAANGKLDPAKLPKTQNLRGRANQSIGHMAEVRTATIRLVQKFYPKDDPKVGWSQALKREFEARLPEGDEELIYLIGCVDFLRKVVDWRNALEHPKAGQQVTFLDYELSADGEIIHPTIEIEHNASPVPRQDMIQFLTGAVSSLGNAFEALITTCCDQNVRQMHAAFTTHVARLPNPDHRHGSSYIWETKLNEGFSFPPTTSAEPTSTG